MELSVLDQVAVSTSQTGVEGIQDTILLAKEAEKLGYKRYWLAEHHNSKAFGSSSPELIVAYLAAATERIRVGTGGVMLMHYSPYKIAENVKTLEGLAPGRIDFGAGRAPGGDHDSTYALATSKAPDFSDQYTKMDDVLKMVNEEEDKTSNRRLQDVYTLPSGLKSLPEAWMLGSSGRSAAVTGSMGIGYAFAHFFAKGAINEEIFETYRDCFRPSAYLDQPRVIIAYLCTVAETEEEARRRALPQDIQLLAQQAGREVPMPSLEEAKDMDLTDEQLAEIEDNRSIHLVGTAEQVAERLRADQEKHGADELMICSNQADLEGRLATYRLLAEELL